MSEYDEIIDPDSNIEALTEAMNISVQDVILSPPLELLNGKRIKVRYQPQSIGASLEYDHGTPIATNVRKPKFDFYKWAKEYIPKLNTLALKNIQIVNDIGKPDMVMGRGEVRLSLIPVGEFRRLQDACFPGTSDTQDLTDEDSTDSRPRGKGIRSKSHDTGAAV